MNSRVLIFTKRVLPRSNTFVATQGNNLPSYQPVYIGLRKKTDGLPLIGKNQSCILEDHTIFPFLSRTMLDGFQHINPKWLQALDQLSAKAIHAHFGKGGYYCSPLAAKLSLPLVTTFHGSDITQKDKFSYRQKHREVCFSRSEKIIAASRFIEQKLIERGCPGEKIIQLYGGIDNRFFKPDVQKSNIPTILFVGRLIEQKGCHYLLDAMKSINQKLPDAQLIVAGYGSEEKKLKAMSTSLENISFAGPLDRDQIKQQMSEAWVTCIPSIIMKRGNEEGLSTVALESQAVGTPVVGFDTGGLGEAVLNGETGLLSEQRNADELADNLLHVLGSNAAREKMAQAGIERVNSMFNAYKQCEKLEALYTDVQR